MPDNEYTQVNLSPQLRTWAKINGIQPITLHRRTGWSYPYCHDLLSGKRKFSHSSMGLFALVFGIEALTDIFKMAKIQVKEK